MTHIVDRLLFIVALLFALSLVPTSCAYAQAPKEQREESLVHKMFLQALSCESLVSLGENLAEEVVHYDDEVKARCRKRGPICDGYKAARAEVLQSLFDVDEVGNVRCGWDRP